MIAACCITICITDLYSCRDNAARAPLTCTARQLSARDSLFSDMLSNGKTAELAEIVSQIYRNSSQNGNLKGLCTSYLISAYTSLGMQDSAKKYMESSENIRDITDLTILGKLYNEKAKYHIKFELDYVSAMDCLQKALKAHSAANDTINEIIVLNNISSIYYLRKDTVRCFNHIDQAKSLANLISDPFSECVCLTFSAQMYYSFGLYEQSLQSAKEALALIAGHPELESFIPTVCINEGYVYITRKEYGMALECYNTAMKHIDAAARQDRSIISNTDIFYADYLYDTGDTELSKKYYLKSLENQEGGRHNRQRVLKRLSELYNNSSKKDSALIFYKQYHEISDSIFNFYNEREFNELMLNSETEKYRKDITDKTQRLSRTRRLAITVSCTAFATVLILVILFTVYRKKDRMYTDLVKKHQELIKKRKEERESIINKTDSKEKMETDLFNRIENLMDKDKVYRNADISLETISEMLGTNRTYISNVINKYSGMSFSNYVNSFRIREATELISDTSKDILVKTLYSRIGYNSISSFYRAFQKETGCTPAVYIEKIRKLQKNDTQHPL